MKQRVYIGVIGLSLSLFLVGCGGRQAQGSQEPQEPAQSVQQTAPAAPEPAEVKQEPQPSEPAAPEPVAPEPADEPKDPAPFQPPEAEPQPQQSQEPVTQQPPPAPQPSTDGSVSLKDTADQKEVPVQEEKPGGVWDQAFYDTLTPEQQTVYKNADDATRTQMKGIIEVNREMDQQGYTDGDSKDQQANQEAWSHIIVS